jgi:hypothetical protein
MYITKSKITKIQNLTSFTQIRELKLLANLLQKYFYVPMLERITSHFEMYLRKKLVDNDQRCFAFTPQGNFPAHNLNFH